MPGGDPGRWPGRAGPGRCLRYGASFPIESKHFKVAGWYFAVSAALDLMTAYQLEPKTELLAAAVSNLNFEAGANPNNVAFLTGVGWRRQHEIVCQFSQNARPRCRPTVSRSARSKPASLTWIITRRNSAN